MYSVDGKICSVVGAARSGIAAACLLAERGATVLLSESKEKLLPVQDMNELQSLGVTYEFGGHTAGVFDAELLVISPGVPSNVPVIVEAKKRGIEVVSEIELASRLYTGKIIGITGSNGKTTTTVLTGEILKNAGVSHFVAGNIGYPFADAVRKHPEAAYAILEISSFQLDHIRSYHPYISVITNITPDHLDRYNGDYNAYIDAKRNIFLNQTESDWCIYNYDDPIASKYMDGCAANRIPCSVEATLNEQGCYLDGSDGVLAVHGNTGRCTISEMNRLHIKGAHNQMNALMAAGIARIIEADCASIGDTIHAFQGVEHRLEFVREKNGVAWYNDSKATNVDSAFIALKGFERNVIMIAGGKDKGGSYDPLRTLVQERVKALILIGEAADIIEKAFAGDTEIIRATSLEAAVEIASIRAVEGDTVLLSPACASFDMFDNYEERGRVFKSSVMSLD